MNKKQLQSIERIKRILRLNRPDLDETQSEAEGDEEELEPDEELGPEESSDEPESPKPNPSSDDKYKDNDAEIVLPITVGQKSRSNKNFRKLKGLYS
jgi:hypothetical protein